MGQSEGKKQGDGSHLSFDLTLASPMMKKSSKSRSKSATIFETSSQSLPKSYSRMHQRSKSNMESLSNASKSIVSNFSGQTSITESSFTDSYNTLSTFSKYTHSLNTQSETISTEYESSCDSTQETFEDNEGSINTFYKRTLSGLSSTLTHLTSCGNTVAAVANCADSTVPFDTNNDDETVSMSDIFSPKKSDHLAFSRKRNVSKRSRNLIHVQQNLQNRVMDNPSMLKALDEMTRKRYEDTKTEESSNYKTDFSVYTESTYDFNSSEETSIDRETTSSCSEKESDMSHSESSNWANFDDDSQTQYDSQSQALRNIIYGNNDPLESATIQVTGESDESHQELEYTYLKHRMNQEYVKSVMNYMDFSLPMHFMVENERTNKLVNIASEPHGVNFMVRGPTYLKDGIKIRSNESLFALLGVDHVMKKYHNSYDSRSFRDRFQKVCENANVKVPFLLMFHIVLPWGHLVAYMYRPEIKCNNGPFNETRYDIPAERVWKKFLEGDNDYRDARLKMIPRIVKGPWMVKKMVGNSPAVIGHKVPITYYGSARENYLEIKMDITKGGSMANSITNTCGGKADLITVDLGFLIEGTARPPPSLDRNSLSEERKECPNSNRDVELPEVILGAFRLHHLDLKKSKGV